VICVDEFGPLNLLPRAGKVWRPAGRTRRLPATYTRTEGVRHMLAALDLATGKMFYRIKDRKRAREFLSLLRALRARWPGEKLYMIADNFSTHKHATVKTWCAANQVELAFLPTYASWLNWIECEFAALRYFALNGTDHQTHPEQGRSDRRLHPLARPPRQTQDQLRTQFTNPQTRLHHQGRVTRPNQTTAGSPSAGSFRVAN
jgi:transposase